MKIMKRLIKVQSSTQVQNQECNYADNYYGDQVCTIKKHKSS